MDPQAPKYIRWLRHPAGVVLVTALLLACVYYFDRITGPNVETSVAYFLPITYAAWASGRFAALFTALVAESLTYFDQVKLIEESTHSTTALLTSVITRLLVYLFVAEVTARLAQSMRAARRAAIELRNAYAHLDADVAAGGLLQRNLLEFAPVDVPGCEVGAVVKYARQVGGDYADAAVLNGHVFACVADISGKGTPAALFAALLDHLLEDAHLQGLRGGAALEYVNESLYRSLSDETFVTLFYVEIDPISGQLEYVNAGHTEGLLYRASAGEIDIIGTTTTPLGMFEDELSARTGNLQMGPRDVLVLYTDGATESKMLGGDRVGETRIHELVMEHSALHAQEMAERIINMLEAETDPALRDDLTVMCLKWTGRTVL